MALTNTIQLHSLSKAEISPVTKQIANIALQYIHDLHIYALQMSTHPIVDLWWQYNCFQSVARSTAVKW